MSNLFYLKNSIINFALASIASLLLSFYEINWGLAFIIGALAYITPNVIFFTLAWLGDVNQTIIKGIAIRYFVMIFIKYLIIVVLFGFSLGFFGFPLLPLLAGYFASLLYQVLYALFAKQTAI
ncbi:hypothetical protein [Thorsellia anophelis]|uniref:ATP synthase I chain n=1 Tax=Thorsellia anophelis DSM 18579 TaxID=1123402 RepID=A0A1I0DPH5_9GAMM|nr:hypothetical protein [Thorsellia anophelis]SET34033.1 hypothetical protein SAMN02583745_02054 [Thorsellia anophelis DSM 18579]